MPSIASVGSEGQSEIQPEPMRGAQLEAEVNNPCAGVGQTCSWKMDFPSFAGVQAQASACLALRGMIGGPCLDSWLMHTERVRCEAKLGWGHLL